MQYEGQSYNKANIVLISTNQIAYILDISNKMFCNEGTLQANDSEINDSIDMFDFFWLINSLVKTILPGLLYIIAFLEVQ